MTLNWPHRLMAPNLWCYLEGCGALSGRSTTKGGLWRLHLLCVGEVTASSCSMGESLPPCLLCHGGLRETLGDHESKSGFPLSGRFSRQRQRNPCVVHTTPGLCHRLLPLSVCGGLGTLQPVSVLPSCLPLNTLPSYRYTPRYGLSH